VGNSKKKGKPAERGNGKKRKRQKVETEKGERGGNGKKRKRQKGETRISPKISHLGVCPDKVGVALSGRLCRG
jgi:hypothetical protein